MCHRSDELRERVGERRAKHVLGLDLAFYEDLISFSEASEDSPFIGRDMPCTETSWVEIYQDNLKFYGLVCIQGKLDQAESITRSIKRTGPAHVVCEAVVHGRMFKAGRDVGPRC